MFTANPGDVLLLYTRFNEPKTMLAPGTRLYTIYWPAGDFAAFPHREGCNEEGGSFFIQFVRFFLGRGLKTCPCFRKKKGMCSIDFN